MAARELILQINDIRKNRKRISMVQIDGIKIRKYRISMDLSTIELAKQANISAGYVSEIENGKYPKVSKSVANSLSTVLRHNVVVRYSKPSKIHDDITNLDLRIDRIQKAAKTMVLELNAIKRLLRKSASKH
jgi:transcriptional regulator with XRE-family HTH domain